MDAIIFRVLQYFFPPSVDGSTSLARPLYDKGNYDEIRNDLQGVDWNIELKGKFTETYSCE